MRQKAVDTGKACVENAFKFLEKFSVLHVEYRLFNKLPGLDIPILGFADLIGHHEDHGILLVDMKSSAQKPKNNMQLETYNALAEEDEQLDGYGPFKGYWLMVRPDAKPKTEKARLFDFEMSAEQIGARYQKVYEAMQAKQYQATSKFCDFCTQKPNCLAQSGPTKRALYYDKSETDGIPF